MRLQDKAVVGQMAPSTCITLAMFQKIDWPVEFIRPAGVKHLTLGFVDHHQRAGLQQRVHEPILRSHECVAMMHQIHGIQ